MRLRLLVEGLAIVASILIAFSLDAAWAAHKDRIQEREILQGLTEEFTANEDAVIGSREAGRSQVETLERLLEMEPEAFLSLEDQEALQLAEVFSHRPFQPAQAELDAVIASGAFGLLRTSGLKQALSGWRRSVARLEKQESAQLAAADEFLDELRGHGVATALVHALGSGGGRELREAWADAMSDVRVRDAAAVTLMVRHSYLTGDLSLIESEAGAILDILGR